MSVSNGKPGRENGKPGHENGHLNGTSHAAGSMDGFSSEINVDSGDSTSHASGQTQLDGHSKPLLGESGVPELPHITSNIIPLSNVMKFYSQETFKQLNTIIENLSMSKDKESDLTQKKKFLAVIISLRQDFLKLYTLVKWTSKSKQVGKLIDLLNWFRTQEFYFEQLSLGLNELNGFSGAKLPNSDLITSLEVLIKGRPQLPSYNLIKSPEKISPEKILSVLEELNLLLTTRLALTDNIPTIFLRHNTIKDGRINFHLPKKFEVSITIGNDLITGDNSSEDGDDDYLKSPYFFIDFKFLFAINPESSNLQSDLITPLSPADKFWFKLEKQCNAILLDKTNNLAGLYKFLIRFSQIFKLKLIFTQQLSQLNRLKWSHIKYRLININNTSKILINYWGNDNFIELIIDQDLDVVVNWYKHNKLIQFPDLTINNDNFHVEHLLTSILNKHCGLLMEKIYHTYPKIFKLINPYQILIKLTLKKSTILSVDSLTGKFYFIDPSVIELQILRKINNVANVANVDAGTVASSKDKDIMAGDEDDDSSLISYINDQLIELKLLTIAKEIHNKLITIEWINNGIITLKADELSKLKPFLDRKHFKVQYFRCKNWPSSWFLINLIDDEQFSIHWYVSRIKSIKGEWKLEWVSDLSLSDNNLDNFKFFNDLSEICSNKIIDNMISQELVSRDIKSVEIGGESAILREYVGISNTNESTNSSKSSIKVSSNGFNNSSKDSININNGELILLVFNEKSQYLPIANSSNSFILKFDLINNPGSKLIKIKLQSKLNINLPQLNQIHLPNLQIDSLQKYFEINKEINLVNFNFNVNINLLSDIFDTLYKFSRLINLMNELAAHNIEVLEYNEVIFKIKINEFFKEIYVGLDEPDETDFLKPPGRCTFYFKYNPNEKNTIKLIINYVNKCLCYAKQNYSFLQVINYFHQITPIMESISHLTAFLNSTNKFKLPNGLNKLNLDLKFINLNNFELLFSLNYLNNNNVKKIQKDKIILNLKFKLNKFKINNNLDLIISLIDNINIKNLKYKKLFELIFKTLNGNDNLINLNYDFIINLKVIDEFLLEIGKCFLNYIEHEI